MARVRPGVLLLQPRGRTVGHQRLVVPPTTYTHWQGRSRQGGSPNQRSSCAQKVQVITHVAVSAAVHWNCCHPWANPKIELRPNLLWMKVRADTGRHAQQTPDNLAKAPQNKLQTTLQCPWTQTPDNKPVPPDILQTTLPKVPTSISAGCARESGLI